MVSLCAQCRKKKRLLIDGVCAACRYANVPPKKKRSPYPKPPETDVEKELMETYGVDIETWNALSDIGDEHRERKLSDASRWTRRGY